MKAMVALFKEPQGLFWHGAALLYALAAYGLGLAGLFHASWSVNTGAMLFLAHGMVIAAYLIHECAHNTIFAGTAHNALLGRALNWITGSAYNTFEDIRYKHFRHHVDNDDVACFDYVEFFLRHPRLLQLVRALEWAYVPAHELIMHGYMVAAPFLVPQRHGQRRRVIGVATVRAALFLAMAWVSPRAALLYALAYLFMLTVLRFMDSVQHDYDYSLTLYGGDPAPRRGDLAWEQEHTFSNPLSLAPVFPNWLVLNFGFHNAHHARPATPWYRLPTLHRELFGDAAEHVVPLRAQLAAFHRHRLARILGHGGELDAEPKPRGRDYLQAARAGRVYGGNAASFLTSF